MLKIGMKKQIHCICFMRVSREKTKEKEIITLKREATSKNVEEKHKKKSNIKRWSKCQGGIQFWDYMICIKK